MLDDRVQHPSTGKLEPYSLLKFLVCIHLFWAHKPKHVAHTDSVLRIYGSQITQAGSLYKLPLTSLSLPSLNIFDPVCGCICCYGCVYMLLCMCVCLYEWLYLVLVSWFTVSCEPQKQHPVTRAAHSRVRCFLNFLRGIEAPQPHSAPGIGPQTTGTCPSWCTEKRAKIKPVIIDITSYEESDKNQASWWLKLRDTHTKENMTEKRVKMCKSK